GDKHISSIDALIVINLLNSKLGGPILPGTPPGPPFPNTNNDSAISSIDALLVINALNSGGGGEGESGPLAQQDSVPDADSLLVLLAADVSQQAAPRTLRLRRF